MNKIYINLFGDGIRTSEYLVPLELYEKLEKFKHSKNYLWEILLFDIELLNHFGIETLDLFLNNKPSVKSKINGENKLEIKEKNKFLLKTTLDSILNKESLFDLYKTQTIFSNFVQKENFKTIIINQFEIGLIGKYEVITDYFDVNQLIFEISKEETTPLLLNEFYYENKKSKKILEDTLIRGHQVIIKEIS